MSAPNVPRSTDSLFVFKNVRLTLRGEGGELKPHVASITVDLVENGIPTVVCVIDPKHRQPDPGSSANQELEDASSASLAELKEWSDRVQAYVSDPQAEADLELEVQDVRGDAEQRLKLQKWLIVGSGMTGISAAGGFMLAVQLQHPAGAIDRLVSTVGYINEGAADWGLTVDASDPIKCFAALFKEWANVLRTVPPANAGACAPADSASPEALLDVARKQLLQTAQKWPETFEFKTAWPNNEPGYSTWPLMNTCFAQASFPADLLPSLLKPYVENVGISSSWEQFASALASEFALTVMPVYWKEKLWVVPFTPWGHPVITLFDDQISTLDFPNASPVTLAGARIAVEALDDGLKYSGYQESTDGMTMDIAGEALYIAPGAVQGQAGRIYESNMFPFLSTALRLLPAYYAGSPVTYGAASSSTYTALGEQSEGQVVKSQNQFEWERVLAKLSFGAAQRVAKQLFLAQYRAGNEISFTSCLLMQTPSSKLDDNYVAPGCVVRIKARMDTSVILDFYVQRVIHTISVQDRRATTEWVGAFVRPEQGYEGFAKNGTWNPIYALT